MNLWRRYRHSLDVCPQLLKCYCKAFILPVSFYMSQPGLPFGYLVFIASCLLVTRRWWKILSFKTSSIGKLAVAWSYLRHVPVEKLNKFINEGDWQDSGKWETVCVSARMHTQSCYYVLYSCACFHANLPLAKKFPLIMVRILSN